MTTQEFMALPVGTLVEWSRGAERDNGVVTELPATSRTCATKYAAWPDGQRTYGHDDGALQWVSVYQSEKVKAPWEPYAQSDLNGTILTRYKDTIFIPLPISEWRLAGDGVCGCDVCKSDKGATLAFWDTLTVGAKPPKKGHNDYASVCHHPGLHSEYKRRDATNAHKKTLPIV